MVFFFLYLIIDDAMNQKTQQAQRFNKCKMDMSIEQVHTHTHARAHSRPHGHTEAATATLILQHTTSRCQLLHLKWYSILIKIGVSYVVIV